MMKQQRVAAVVIALCLGLFCSYPLLDNPAQAQGKAPAAQKITVVNPLGTPPPVKLKAMAPRLKSLNDLGGKAIYVVDDGFVGGDNLLLEIVDWFKQNYPNANAVYKRKGGMGFEAEDPALWAEIKEKGAAVIIGMGH